MKPKIIFGFCLLFFILLNIIAIKTEAAVPNSEKRSVTSCFISQNQINNLTDSPLQHSYSGLLLVSRGITIDIQIFDSKLLGRFLCRFNNCKDKSESQSLLSKYHYPCLHPDLIGYYVYELRKIII